MKIFFGILCLLGVLQSLVLCAGLIYRSFYIKEQSFPLTFQFYFFLFALVMFIIGFCCVFKLKLN